MSNIAVIQKEVYGLQSHFNSILSSREIVFEREAEFALQILGQNEYALRLAMNNKQSLQNAVVNVAAIGVSLNPAKKQAYLVPRDGRICLEISYMGLIDLAVQDGAVLWAKAELVYSNDQFTLSGAGSAPLHQYNPFSKERGNIVGAYCVAKINGGDYLTEAMALSEIESIRDRSSAWKAWIEKQKKCPWVTDFGEMARKTVVKRASKYWASNGSDRLKQAVHYLNTEGEEGLQLEQKQVVPVAQSSFDSDAAYKEVMAAESLDELKALWQKHCSLANAAKDRAGYTMVTAAKDERKQQLMQATDVEVKA